MLDSLTKQGRKLKQRLRGKRNKPDKTGGNTAEESAASSRPVPHIVAGGQGGAGSRTSTDERRIDSGDRSPQPVSVSVGEKEADVDKHGVGKEPSRPDPDADVVEDSGEAAGVYSSSSSASIPPTGEPEGTRALSFQMLYPAILSGNTDTVAPDHGPEDIHPSENTVPSSAADERKSGWKTTASATAKLILRGVRDSADAFPPLKSVAGGLCFILENCEAQSSPVYAVAALTCIPAHEGKQGNDGVIGAPGQNSFRPPLQTRFRLRS